MSIVFLTKFQAGPNSIALFLDAPLLFDRIDFYGPVWSTSVLI